MVLDIDTQKWTSLIQFFKFSVFSTAGTLINLGFVFGTRDYLGDYARFALGILIQDTTNFFINRRLTFEGTGRSIAFEYLKFLSTTLFGAIVYTFLSVLLIQQFGILDVVAGAISLLVSGLVNFFIIKFWVFRKL